ncbi:MAG: hypothetical protein OEV08_11850 [Nitrospira sp.]|nr:hypothetical protein [Nitrospira sp.]
MHLPEKSQQIILVHADLIRAVVMAALNRDQLPALESLLHDAAENGWGALVASIRRMLQGERSNAVFSGLDEEDRVIAEAILRGLQNPSELPEPTSRPEAGMAAPGLASLIHAASTGDTAALKVLGDMAEQMLRAGGDMARLSGILRRLVNGESDVEKLCRGMTPRGLQLVRSLVEELGRLKSH